MKKVIFAAMALGLPVMAGEPAPIVTPAPAPSCPLTLEVAGVYKSAAKELLSYGPAKEIDVMGADLTLVKPICGNSAVTLRFGYNFGDEAQRGVFGGTEEVDVHSFYLMPGYRYTHALTEKTSLYGAVNAGIANTSFKYKFDDAEEIDKWHDSDWGFIATLELGVRYQLCEKTELFAAYEFTANYAKPDGCDEQTYNGVRVGVGFKF
ncbi:MAG: outer membrane beta-barrel protein [Akkermansia sp.]|nr:outer membrane beta-barrel protein [Akkermansia sp.]